MIASFVFGSCVSDKEINHGFQLENQGFLCSSSGGVWQPLLVACICPKNQLFRAFGGCSTIDLDASLSQNIGHFKKMSRSQLEKHTYKYYDDDHLTVYIKYNSFSDKDIQMLSDFLDADPLVFMKGYTLSPNFSGVGSMLLKLAKPSEENAENLFGDDRELRDLENTVVSSSDPLLSQRIASIDDFDEIVACENNLEISGVEQAQAHRICQNIKIFKEEINSNNLSTIEIELSV